VCDDDGGQAGADDPQERAGDGGAGGGRDLHGGGGQHGTTTARNVVVTDPVPQGMGGSPVTVNVGDLAPNQSKSLTVTFKATQRGRFCNVATAESSNAGKVSAEAARVQQPGVKITKEGTRNNSWTAGQLPDRGHEHGDTTPDGRGGERHGAGADVDRGCGGGR